MIKQIKALVFASMLHSGTVLKTLKNLKTLFIASATPAKTIIRY